MRKKEEEEVVVAVAAKNDDGEDEAVYNTAALIHSAGGQATGSAEWSDPPIGALSSDVKMSLLLGVPQSSSAISCAR